MKLFDAYEREIKKGRPILGEVSAGSYRDGYSTYPSEGLTPARLALILKEADAGDITRQAELFEEMEEKDAHLGSVLQTRKLSVTGLQWEVVAATGQGPDQRVSAFVKDALSGIAAWEDSLTDMLDAIGKGFSVMELMWDVSASQGARITELKWRHQKRFTFMQPLGKGILVAEAPRLITDEEPATGEALLPNKFAVHMYRARSGSTSRGGVLRPCAYMYLFKNYTIKDWLIFNERFAMPMRLGKFSPSTSEADRRVLKQAVYNLGSDAAAIISDSTVVELLESDGKSASAEVYERLVDFCDRAISKAVLGQTLTTEQSMGTYATAKVHQSVRQDLVEADAKALSKTISSQIIKPLVQFNFGPGVPLPSFRFLSEENEDLKALAQTYGALVSEMGFDGIPKAHIHERFGIPRPEAGEPTVGPAKGETHSVEESHSAEGSHSTSGKGGLPCH